MSGCVYGYNSRSVKQLKSNAFSIDPPVLFFWLNDPPVLFFWLNDPPVLFFWLNDPPVLWWIGIWLMYFFLGHWFDVKRLIQRNKVVLNILWLYVCDQ